MASLPIVRKVLNPLKEYSDSQREYIKKQVDAGKNVIKLDNGKQVIKITKRLGGEKFNGELWVNGSMIATFENGRLWRESVTDGGSARGYFESMTEELWFDTIRPLVKEGLIPYEQRVEYANQLKSGIDAPFVSVSVGELGGKERISLLLAVSLQKKEDWPNHIFENSPYMRFHLHHDGVLEQFVLNYQFKNMKFRKTRVKSVDEAIKKINDYLKKVKNIGV